MRAEAERILRRRDATPTEGEAERLYQARVAEYARALGFAFAAIYVLGAVGTLLLVPQHFVEIHLHPAKVVNLTLCLASFAVARWIPKRAVSSRLVMFADFFIPVLTMCLVCVVAAVATAGWGLYFVPFLLSALVLMTRAALVPSTPQRTALVGVLTSVPVPLAAYLVARKSELPGFATPLLVAAAGVIWSAAVTACTVLMSRVLYGLYREVESVRRLGQYVLGELIGEGGMGSVYRAEHALLRRPTAVKLLTPERAGPDNLRRFEREVQKTAQLTHPNTVAIYDYGHTAGGVFFYAMELLEGFSLQELVARFGPQPPGRVIAILRQAAGALAEAHALGLVHRDVKPANILLCERGGQPDVVKLLDFGLVKSIGTADVSLTYTGTLLGTPLYMAPEAIGDPSAVDGSADLYALGAVGYFLLCGSPPFEAQTLVEICALHLHQPPVQPSERLGRALPGELEELILTCLEKSSDKRPAGAEALQEALARCAEHSPWSAKDACAFWREHKQG